MLKHRSKNEKKICERNLSITLIEKAWVICWEIRIFSLQEIFSFLFNTKMPILVHNSEVT